MTMAETSLDKHIADNCAIVGANVARLREKAGMGVSELADKAEIAQELTHRIEEGDPEMDVISLTKLANALDVPITTLFEGCYKRQRDN